MGNTTNQQIKNPLKQSLNSQTNSKSTFKDARDLKIYNIDTLKMDTENINNIEELNIIISALHKNYKSTFLFRNIKDLVRIGKLSIEFQQYSLSEIGLRDILGCISQLASLTWLDIHIGYLNNLGTKGCSDIAEFIYQMENLENLSINIGWRNQIESEGSFSLLEGIRDLKKLKSLTLNIGYDNKINPQGMIGICINLKNLIQLEHLTLLVGQNDIQQIGARSIGELFKHLKKLLSLSLTLQQNNIQPEGAFEIFEGIQNLTRLEKLKLEINSNYVSTENLIGLGVSLNLLYNLKDIDIRFGSKNNIDSLALVTLIRSIKTLSHLQSFCSKIDSKAYSNICETLINKEIISFTQLKYLNIAFSLTDIELKPRKIPNYLFRKATRLVYAKL